MELFYWNLWCLWLCYLLWQTLYHRPPTRWASTVMDNSRRKHDFVSTTQLPWWSESFPGLVPKHWLSLTRILVVSSVSDPQHVSTFATGDSPSPVQGTIRKGDEEIENWPPRLGQLATIRWIPTTEESWPCGVRMEWSLVASFWLAWRRLFTLHPVLLFWRT